jgi:dipeptidyl aminopeptidase/acylaminoacyl peptidase
MKTTAAYGTWRSPLTGDFVAGRSQRAGELQWDGDRLFWLETRPAEMGRQTLLCSIEGAPPVEVLPAPWSARSTVHEYGGGSYCARGGRVFFVNAADQQIYKLDVANGAVRALTHTPQCRYADLQFEAAHQRLLAVCEDHSGGAEPQNRLVAIDLIRPDAIQILEEAWDFVSSPRLSPDGSSLAYLTWNHPYMPWDSTRLWRRPVRPDGGLGEAALVAGGDAESVSQPQWSPSGELFWISDKTGWWNLYNNGKAVLPMEAEFAPPQWVFGQSHYGFLNTSTLLAACSRGGEWQIVQLQENADQWGMTQPNLGINHVSQIVCSQGRGAILGAGPKRLQTLWLTNKEAWETLSEQSIVPLTPEDISAGRSLSFPSGDNRAHGFFYPPANARYRAPDGDLPPLIVIGHGGPTSATDPSLSFKIQFWTQRGFAVLDVNYRGSTGYGRTYRDALRGNWGLVDVEDLCAGAEYVTAIGWVHPQKRAIRGSSAGGFSVLCALTDHNTFNAGVSLYGIGDLEALACDTHKFEARYLDSLVGPYPAAQSEYVQRSPIHKADLIRCPLLVFQGQQDKVVPPAQAEQMVAAVQRAGTLVDYVVYPDEAHGFRRAANIQHQMDTELAFYQRVFNLNFQETSP